MQRGGNVIAGAGDAGVDLFRRFAAPGEQAVAQHGRGGRDADHAQMGEDRGRRVQRVARAVEKNVASGKVFGDLKRGQAIAQTMGAPVEREVAARIAAARRARGSRRAAAT